MNKTTQGILIVIVILIVLYVVYRFVFQNKTVATNNLGTGTVPIFNGLSPYEYHASQATSLPALNTDITANPNINTDYNGYKESLNAILAVLGYKINTNGNTRVVSATGKTLEKVQLKYPGDKLLQLDGNWKIDSAKWDLFDKLGLLTITYDYSKDQQSFIVYNKFIEFFGPYFFNSAAKETVSKIVEATKNANAVDCNSQEYKDKLLRLSVNLKDAGNKYQIAVFNINAVDNAENTQALNKTSQDLNNADNEYKKHAKLCQTN